MSAYSNVPSNSYAISTYRMPKVGDKVLVAQKTGIITRLAHTALGGIDRVEVRYDNNTFIWPNHEWASIHVLLYL